MRPFLASLMAAAALSGATAVQAQTPRETLESLNVAPSERSVRRAVERAADQPLGSERNPVRVSGPAGERGYIARLRCADGSAPRVGQRSSAGTGPFGTIIDLYPLDCGQSAPGRVSLAMDMYHDNHDETRAPEGFTLVPR